LTTIPLDASTVFEGRKPVKPGPQKPIDGDPFAAYDRAIQGGVVLVS